MSDSIGAIASKGATLGFIRPHLLDYEFHIVKDPTKPNQPVTGEKEETADALDELAGATGRGAPHGKGACSDRLGEGGCDTDRGLGKNGLSRQAGGGRV